MLVCAPAVTARRRCWPARPGTVGAVAWLSLVASDDVAAPFSRHAVATLDSRLARDRRAVRSTARPPVPQSFEGLVTAVINELPGRSGPATCRSCSITSTWSDPSRCTLHLASCSTTCHLACIPSWPARRSAACPGATARHGRSPSCGTATPSTADEAAAFLRERPPQLPAAAVAALTGRTRAGRPGCGSAALSLRGQPDVEDRFVAAFTGSHRFVLDYLTEEVLEHQPEQLRAFLLETSVLQRLSGPLCNAVTVTGRQPGPARAGGASRAVPAAAG